MSSEHYGELTNSVREDISGPETANLYSIIDRANVHGLNLTVPEDAQSIIKEWSEREDTTHYVDSGVDDQLIIHVPFSQNVRLRSVLLKLGRGEFAPRHLRLYANYPNIVDFAEAESSRPHFNITLLEGETSVVEYPLRAAAFASVSTLSLFFDEAVGEEVSRVYYIGFRGDTRSARKEGTNKLEIPAANAADAPLVDRVREKSGGQQSLAR